MKNRQKSEAIEEQLRKTAKYFINDAEIKRNSVFIFFELFQGQLTNQDLSGLVPLSPSVLKLFCPQVYHFKYVPGTSPLDWSVTELLTQGRLMIFTLRRNSPST